jgi:hypothetical protein
MHKFLLALFTGVVPQPAEPAPAPPPAITQTAPASAVVTAAAAVAAMTPPPAAALPPVVEQSAVARARAEVRQSRVAGGGKVSHRFEFPGGDVVEFSDRSRNGRDQAQRARVVSYGGTQSAGSEPDSTFEAAGRTFNLSPQAIAALRYVSRHEGGFDAINTWDRARFSWGFIQFAGGYGFPPALAHFREQRPELFQRLLGDYGVDSRRDEEGNPVPIYVDPKTGAIRRGADAEQAYGDDPLVIALFIRAGRVPEVKQVQVEAAIRDYAAPALEARHRLFGDVRLSDVLGSPQALAMLIDRQVHEGTIARLEWSLEHARIVNNAALPADWSRLEAQVLDLAVRDADSRAKIAELLETAGAGLGRARSAAANGQVQLAADGPSLNGARDALRQALALADYGMVTSPRRDQVRTVVLTALASSDPGRARASSPAVLAADLSAQQEELKQLTGRFRFEYAVRNRLNGIRGSDLQGPR